LHLRRLHLRRLHLRGHRDAAVVLPWRLLGTTDPIPTEGHWLVEVHPAVALGAWWEGPLAMARYKPGGRKAASDVRAARRVLIEHLQRSHGFPDGDPDERSDDRVDAWAAWRLASLLMSGDVARWGPDDGAYYLMPPSQAWPG
jgi:hypothetical protein